MDRKFDSDNQPFTSGVVSLRKFLEAAWNEDSVLRESLHLPPADIAVKEEMDHTTQMRINFADALGIADAEAINIFDKELSLTNLVRRPIDAERNLERYQKLPLMPKRFHTHTYTEARVKNAAESAQKKSNYLRTMKYDKYENGALGPLTRILHPSNAVTQKDIIMTVTLYCPYNKILTNQEMKGHHMLIPQTKFLVRGETTLMNFRKKLVCVCDVAMELPDGKELEPPSIAHAHLVRYPSAFIFIHDTFYIDRSNPNSTDTSAPIREFMTRKPIFDPVQCKDMEGVKFIDIELRLGQPYVFQHSGTCEHLFVFHDLRVLHRGDFQDVEDYPLLVVEKTSFAKCYGCKINSATFIVEECDRLPMTTALFCESCFREFHFVHGAKIGHFRASPFYDMGTLRIS
ncbi:hypothetical protein WR25_00053 [Diploscapter pachys]|uniref:Uncharacterized protein n=1 Tax=Diploscapter pachys TaxID=2018661 RepID=A0A2A2KE89_9BILA|nr:hypothetical protein WR25_00053 [Diploscapter pachys]